MAVMPMKRISIYALKNRRKQILELIQRRGVVEIDDRKADETVFAKMARGTVGCGIVHSKSSCK